MSDSELLSVAVKQIRKAPAGYSRGLFNAPHEPGRFQMIEGGDLGSLCNIFRLRDCLIGLWPMPRGTAAHGLETPCHKCFCVWASDVSCTFDGGWRVAGLGEMFVGE
jgi:hypothetical protein